MGCNLRRMIVMALVAVVGGAGGWLPVKTAVAQRSGLTITPFVGGYIPLKPLGELDFPLAGITTTVTADLKTGPAFGGKLTLMPGGKRFGVEGTYFYASSKTRIRVSLLGREDDATVQGGSLKALFRATDGKTDTDVIFSAGVSGTTRSGDVFRLAQAVDQFDIGGVVGLGLHLILSPQVTFRLDGDLSLYKWNWRGSLPNTSQADLLITAGLGLKLGR